MTGDLENILEIPSSSDSLTLMARLLLPAHSKQSSVQGPCLVLRFFRVLQRKVGVGEGSRGPDVDIRMCPSLQAWVRVAGPALQEVVLNSQCESHPEVRHTTLCTLPCPRRMPSPRTSSNPRDGGCWMAGEMADGSHSHLMVGEVHGQLYPQSLWVHWKGTCPDWESPALLILRL